jgi:hypothetical protein
VPERHRTDDEIDGWRAYAARVESGLEVKF